MHSASSFDGIGSPLGTFQVMTPFPETQLRNSSHIQEVYQNLPQLQKAIFLPITYKSYEIQNAIPPSYSDVQSPTVPPSLHAKPPGNNHKFYYHPKQRQEYELEKDQAMHKRNGWGGWGDAGHHHHHESSPALSALALLGFMFFLQLIQNSLQNNRQMLAATTLTQTTGTVTGRDMRHLNTKSRRKRSIREDKELQKTFGYATNDKEPNKKVFAEKSDAYNNLVLLSTISPELNSTMSFTHYKKTNRTPVTSKLKNDPIELLRSSSVHCCQLLACKIGESIYDRLDTTTGFMIRMLGATMIPRVPRKTWAGRLLRAFDKGWKKESCDHLYKNCGILYKLFYKATNAIQAKKYATWDGQTLIRER